MYNLNDDSTKCPVCNVDRYDSKVAASQQIQLLLPVGDIISKLLSDDRVRQDLRYRATYEREGSDSYKDFFDGAIYLQSLSQGKLSNEDDCLVSLYYTDKFLNAKRGSTSYTMIHMVILNFNRTTRFKEHYHFQLGIIASNTKKIALDSFLGPILAELHYLETFGMTVKTHGVYKTTAKCFLVSSLALVTIIESYLTSAWMF